MQEIKFIRQATDNVTIVYDNTEHFYPCFDISYKEQNGFFKFYKAARLILEFDYNDVNLTISPSSNDIQEFKNKLHSIIGIIEGGFGTGPIQPQYIFESELSRDTYFVANINANAPLENGQQIVTGVNTNQTVIQVWCGETVTSPTVYNAYTRLPWINR